MRKEDESAYALLCIQGAFLEMVTHDLRAVAVWFDESNKYLYHRIYFDGDPKEAEPGDDWGIVICESGASFGIFRGDTDIIKIEEPETIPIEGRLAYLRYGENKSGCYTDWLNRNILEVANPEALIKAFQNKENGLHQVGQNNFIELVDFGEPIGYWVNRTSLEKTPTALGIICYQQINGEMVPQRLVPACSKPASELAEYPVAYALLAAQAALLDRAASELYAVIVDYTKETQELFIRIYYDGNPAHEILTQWQEVIYEICADMGPGVTYNAKILHISNLEKIPAHGRYAHLKKVSSGEQIQFIH